MTETAQVTERLVSLGEVKVRLVDSLDEAFECKRWLSTKSRIAIDTECTGLSRQIDDVRLVQFGDENTAYVVPIEVTETVATVNMPTQRGLQSRGWGGFACEIMEQYTGAIDMHNAPYDTSMIRKTMHVHLPRHRIDDTRLMQHVLDSRGSLALKSIATKLVDPLAAHGQHMLHDSMGKDTGWNWANVPTNFAPFWFYAGLDTILTARVSSILRPQVMSTAPRAYDLEMAVAWPCDDMANRGVRLDRNYTNEFGTELSRFVKETEEWCRETYDVNPGSDAKVIDILLADGVNLTKRTDSGARYSIDKEVLSGITHPLAEGVLARRQAMKMLSYLNAYVTFAGPDDLIHPSINTVGGTGKNPFEPGGGQGVRTGRMSMSDPNLQNVPVRTKEGAKIRRCFIPRDGHTWIKCDADQIESRIMAHLSGDENMRNAFLAEGDFFVNMAAQLFGEPDFKKADPRRQFVKNGVYAKEYGAGIPKFAKTAGTSEDAAFAFMTAFDRMFPGVPTWINHTQSVVAQRFQTEGVAYARSPLTGRRHVVEGNKIYPIINYLIQGMAGEILKLKIVQAAQAGLDRYMLFPVHDEIDLDVPNDELPDVLATLNDVMNDDELLTVPITWTSDIGPSWGECKS